uniref:Fucose-specific lectin n=1 Tax=Bionectria ochroleuca TaxID=29856 RepID=A0A8H7TQJ0_BIOOC
MAPYVLFTLFFYLLISAVAADPSVSIAAAYDAEINDGWARYVYWLRPDGKIMMQGRDIAPIEREEIQQTVKPQDNSPLAALYRRKDTGARELFVSYLDKEGNMIDVACRHKGDKYVDWSTHQLKYKASSGLALAEADHKLRRFYIDDEDYVTQAIESKITRLGPKAARGSKVSAAVPIGSTDIHVFFISEDKKSLASLTYNGTNNKWSTDHLPVIKDFTKHPKSGFSAAAWSNPSIIRVFYINKDRLTSEWTLDGGSWINTTDTLSTGLGAEPYGPVAASRSVNGSGRYLEYFYTADGGQINYLAKNSEHSAPFKIEVSNFDFPKAQPLSREEKINLGVGIGVGLGVGIPTLIATVVGLKCWKRRSVKDVEETNNSDQD